MNREGVLWVYLKMPEFNNIYIFSQCEKEIDKLLNGFSHNEKFRQSLRVRLKKLNDPEINCLDFPNEFEHIEGNIDAITFRHKEKNIRILYNFNKRGIIYILLCAFDEKKTPSDYQNALRIAKFREKRIFKKKGFDCMSNQGRSEIFSSLFQDLTDVDIKASDLKFKISKAIYRKRKELNMSQKEFAEFMNVSQGMVSKWESFEYNFTIESIVEICCKLDLNFDVTIESEVAKYKSACLQTECSRSLVNGWSVYLGDPKTTTARQEAV